MKSIRKICLVLLVSLSLCLPAWAAEFSAELHLSMGRRVMKGKIFVKGQKQRLEIPSPQGGKVVTLVDIKSGKSWLLMPAAKMYMETPLHPGDGIYQVVKGVKALPPGAKKVASGKKSGYTCDVYELKNKKGHTVKVWMARGLDYPVFTITEDPDMGQVVSLLKNIEEAKQPERLFKVPAGYRRMNMNMGRGMGSPHRP